MLINMKAERASFLCFTTIWSIELSFVRAWIPPISPQPFHITTISAKSNKRRPQTILYESKGNEDESSEPGPINEPDNLFKYKRPKFSEAFRKHMEEVKGSFPINEDEGVDCTGEPSMDPSRMVSDNGLDSEYLSDC